MIKSRIDLRKVCDYIDGEFDRKIISGLEKSALLSEDYVYTCFNFLRAREVEKTGMTVHPSEKVFYAFARNELIWDNGETNCLRTRLKEVSTNPGIAVYDINFLQKAYLSGSKFGYEFKEGIKPVDALKGIVKIFLPD